MTPVDVVVIGAGPAGIAAALAAVEAGASVTLIDEHPAPGGQLRWRVVPLPGVDDALGGLPSCQAAEQLGERLARAGVSMLMGAVAWGLFDDNQLAVAGPDGGCLLQAEKIVVASGSVDLVLPFPGWTLPGVMTARAAQILLHCHRVLPGRRIAILGRGPDAAELIHDLETAGAEIVLQAADPAQVAASGRDRVERVSAGGQSREADALVIALGRQPDPELALQAQVDLGYSSRLGCHLPLRNELLESSRPGLYVAGEAAGTVDLVESFAEGRLAGFAASGTTSERVATAREALVRVRSAARAAEVERLRLGASHAAQLDEEASAPWRSWALAATAAEQDAPLSRAALCRCEQVTVGEVRQAIAEGARTIDDIKRRTRAGMGLCQGIFCTQAMMLLLHAQQHLALADIPPMTERPPARPLPLTHLIEIAERLG
jgi:pyruvate/2-oxoglutarate dehydrogenase complex dihydrolipoamide dehydrogenase (E3) component/bacterioferritin-associated ferredoxin